MSHCNEKTEVYSRIVGYFRPVQQWNNGKQHEYRMRKTYQVPETTDLDTFESMVISDAEFASQRVSGDIAH